MRDKQVNALIVLTFLGMVGLYVLLILAYQKYQNATAKSGTLGAVLSLLGGGGPSAGP